MSAGSTSALSASSNGWKQWAAGAALTAAMAALGAYSGAAQRLTRVEEHQAAMDRDVARVEAKLDRLIESDAKNRDQQSEWRREIERDMMNRRK